MSICIDYKIASYQDMTKPIVLKNIWIYINLFVHLTILFLSVVYAEDIKIPMSVFFQFYLGKLCTRNCCAKKIGKKFKAN